LNTSVDRFQFIWQSVVHYSYGSAQKGQCISVQAEDNILYIHSVPVVFFPPLPGA